MLRDVRALKRRVLLGVYAVITLDLPLYFLLDYTVTQVIGVAIVGWIVAAVTINVTFAAILSLRKRTSYPSVLLTSLSDNTGSRAAAEESLRILRSLLEPDAAFLQLDGPDGGPGLLVCHGLTEDAAREEIAAHANALATARDVRYPMLAIEKGPRTVVFVPIVSLRRSIGALYIAGPRSNSDLRDRQLLAAIGAALGLSLENLRQREQIVQKEARLGSVVTSAPVVLFAVDKSGVMTFMQGQGMARLGVSPDVVVGRSIWDVYAGYPEIMQSFRRCFAGESLTSIAEFNRENVRLTFEYRLSPERDNAGRVVGIIGVATDITERKLAEDALRQSEQALAMLVSNLPGFAYRWHCSDVHTLEYVSDGITDITGYRPHEFLSGARVYRDILHPDDLDAVRDHVLAAVRAGKSYQVTYRVLTAAGDEKWVWEQGQPIANDDGETVSVEAFVSDVTERKRAEEALAESERFLSTLVSNLPGFVVRRSLDEPATIQYVSEGVEPLTGMTVEQLQGAPLGVLSEMVEPADRDRLREEIQQALARRQPFSIEFRAADADAHGKTRWLLEQGQVVLDESGEPTAVEAFVMDITQRKQAEEAALASEERFRDLFENARDAIFTYNFGGRFLSANRQCAELTGYSLDELLTRNVAQIVPPEYHVVAAESLKRVFRGEESLYEIEILRKDGTRVPVEIGARVVTDATGRPRVVHGIARDLTDRRRAEQALADSEERYRDLYENANDIIFTHDPHGIFHTINRKAIEVSGYLPEDLVGTSVWNIVAPEFHDSAREASQRVLSGESPGPFEVEVIRKDGSRVPLEISERVLLDDDGVPVLIQGIARDVSERRQAEETIRRLAYHDALTDLPNRALFEDRLAIALAQARRQHEMLAVMFLDLDRFKMVNDTLGHGAGDQLLETVAHDLSLLVREGDTVARVGGDEFTLLLPGIETTEDAVEIAQRILDCLRQPRLVGGQEFRTTGSIGITTYPADGRDSETLLRNADTAMYRAKERGRDNYQLYTPAMNDRMMERLAYENDLRHALAREEFQVYYQPIIDVQTGALKGAEALLRWMHPERGIIAPNDFIPFAEESGQIVEIGESVLLKACLQIKAWDAAGISIPRVAVNLSARQLQQEDLVARVAAILRQTGVAAPRIQLEITEGAVLKNVDAITSMLLQLRAMGVGVALDDFGTGYSSLTYLKRFPVDAVKIDRSFVADLETDASDATIVSTVIAMAENLNLKVIAEGVETANQLDFLRSRNCDEFQGYLVSKPVPPEEFEKFSRSAVQVPRANGRRPRPVSR